jgi:hypothetical protein
LVSLEDSFELVLPVRVEIISEIFENLLNMMS